MHALISVSDKAGVELNGSWVRVRCVADLTGEKVEAGPNAQLLEATEEPSAGLIFPPKLQATWAGLDKAQTTYKLPFVAKLVEATTEAVAVVAKSIFTPRLEALTEVLAGEFGVLTRAWRALETVQEAASASLAVAASSTSTCHPARCWRRTARLVPLSSTTWNGTPCDSWTSTFHAPSTSRSTLRT